MSADLSAARILAALGAALALTACKPLAGKPAPDLPVPPDPIVVSPTGTTTTPPTTTTSLLPPTSVSSAPTSATGTVAPPTTRTQETQPVPPGALAPGQIPAPGQVGFRGDRAKLKVVNGPASAPPGTEWNSGALRFGGGNVTLDGVWVKGGVEYSGSGTLTIRNSVIEGNRHSWSPLMAISGHVDVRDSTITYADSEIPGSQWGNGVVHGDARMTLIRNDISGAPDGIQNGRGNSLIEQNHIHGMRVFGSPPNNTHNDGIQAYGGPNLRIRHNRIDISVGGKAYDGAHQNAAVFIMPSDDNPASNLEVVGNYLSGGGYILRLGTPLSGAVVTGNRFGPTTGGWGEVLLDGGGIASWSGNVDASGNPVPRP
ncbi:right-handed parallel beta-helix repeat-containing protein [Actinokineospora soli]|uniref:Right-handed parallel beta-helix repeat-containing protein n=1 Tax=Actinokineospora soli TaxID=1048753 RepID=A0ABW2TZ62_9PSEU